MLSQEKQEVMDEGHTARIQELHKFLVMDSARAGKEQHIKHLAQEVESPFLINYPPHGYQTLRK